MFDYIILHNTRVEHDCQAPFFYIRTSSIFLKRTYLHKLLCKKKNALINQIQLRYCEICDKTIKIKSTSKHIISESHKNKEKFGAVVEEYIYLFNKIMIQ